ncbi:MAG: response regulator transcription factor, partial [Anaerolineae bacterium]
GTHPDCDVVGQLSGVDLPADVQDAADGLDANEAGETADAVIWDLGWDFNGNPPAWQEIDLPIVALIPDEVETAVFWSTGINAILPRDSSAGRILAAAQAITRGLIVFDPDITRFQTTLLPESAPPVEELTPRELQVIQLIAEGMTNKAIAQQLAISTHTVKFHVNAIMNKLAAQSRTEAVVRATRMGLISL